MLKQIYSLLNISILTIVVLTLGNSALTVFDYLTTPMKYDMMSAPWYLGIQLTVFLSVIVLIPLLIARFFVGRKVKKLNKPDSEV